jgi:predicted pyridoxine 5'-phosphate oxidase superfamily flavin-nucleotide-binding protein
VVDHGDQHRELLKAIQSIIPFDAILTFRFSIFAEIAAISILAWATRLTPMTEPSSFSLFVADSREAMDASPFHPDELEAQARAGHAPRRAGIRNFMPDQHRGFFPLLPYLFVATTDADGWPLATMLNGQPGFVHAPDPVTLRIDTLPGPEDPAAGTFGSGQEIGILGIDFTTRRRNRANGQIAGLDATGFTVSVRQSFGNCAKYIQRRAAHDAPYAPARVETLAGLDAKAWGLIGCADTFFVASRSRTELLVTGGVDISHRGGRPGFVRVDGDALTIPDFPGNRYYNTLGNLLGEPRASLLFIDFETGDLLQLQGMVTIDWSAAATKFAEGAERLWHFEIVRGWRRHAASSLQWSFI